MRPALRAPVLSAALVLLTLAIGPLAAAQGDVDDVMANFPNACRDVDPMDSVATGRGDPLTVLLNGESIEPDLLETGVAQATQAGPGKAGDKVQLLDVGVPDADDPLVTAQLLTGRVDLDVDGPEDGLEAEAWSQARVAHLNVLDGLVTADLVRAFTYARADVRSARTYTDPSTIVGLQVAGISYTDISPGANITLPAALVGAGSYVTVYERMDHSRMPTEESPFYEADVQVRMIHIHVTKAPLLGEVEVYVSDARSRAVAPTPFCGVAQTVEAAAYTARVRQGLESPGILIGEQHIGVTGGSGDQQLFGENFEAAGVQVLVNVTETDVTGNISAGGSSDSHAMSQVLGLCVRLDDGPECFIKATVIKAEATAHADADGATCTGDVQILELVVNGVDVVASVGLDGLGHPEVNDGNATFSVGPIAIYLNQQERTDGDGYCSLYVRAIRIETGLPVVGTVIIGRAYVSAGFEHAGTNAETPAWNL